MTIQTSTGAAPSATPAGRPLLRLTNLTKHFPQFRQTLIKRPDNPVRAVDGISFDVAPGQTVGLVGSPAVASRPRGGPCCGCLSRRPEPSSSRAATSPTPRVPSCARCGARCR